jgi:hypothetical protein
MIGLGKVIFIALFSLLKSFWWGATMAGVIDLYQGLFMTMTDRQRKQVPELVFT